MRKKTIFVPVRTILYTASVCLFCIFCNTASAQGAKNESINVYQKIYEEPLRTKDKLKFIKGDFIYNLYMNSSWVYYGNESPKVSLSAVNTNYKKEKFNIKCDIEQLPGKPVYSFVQETSIDSGDSTLISFAFNSPMPGIYNVKIRNQQDSGTHFYYKFNIAYEPQRIDSESGLGRFPDMKNITKDAAVKYCDSLAYIINNKPVVAKTDYKITKIKSSDNRERKVYLVEIPTKNNRTVKGYYFVPKNGVFSLVKKKSHPTVIRFDYCKENECRVKADDNPDIIEFVVIDTNAGDNYIQLCKDASMIVDFIDSKRITDHDKIFSEGGGRGAVIATAIAAMDRRIGGCATYAPLFTDSLLNDSDFKFPYIAKALSAPFLVEIGLQETESHPLNNFFIYNMITSPKEYYLYTLPKDFNRIEWYNIENNFFEQYNRNSL